MMRLAQEHHAPAQLCAEKALEQCSEILEEHDAAMAGMLGAEMMRIDLVNNIILSITGLSLSILD